LSPNSVQEMFDLTVRAFNLSEEYRTPVILLADEIVTHMSEQLTMPSLDDVKIVTRRKPQSGESSFFDGEVVAGMPSVGEGFNVSVTGSTHDEFGMRFTSDPVVHRKLVTGLVQKITNNVDVLADFEVANLENCEVGLVSYGCTSRAIYETVELAQDKGVEVGFIRLRTVWPFPEKAVGELTRKADVVIVPEMNLGQIFFEVQRVANKAAEVLPLNKIGGGEMLTPDELFSTIMENVRRH
jgi:2-oxoglutarate ferredoxin oxidoreductase subunit alpha